MRFCPAASMRLRFDFFSGDVTASNPSALFHASCVALLDDGSTVS